MSSVVRGALASTIKKFSSKAPQTAAQRVAQPPKPPAGPHPFDAHRTSTWRGNKWCATAQAAQQQGMWLRNGIAVPVGTPRKIHKTVLDTDVNADFNLPVATPEFGSGGTNLRSKSILMCLGFIPRVNDKGEDIDDVVFRAYSTRHTGVRMVKIIANATQGIGIAELQGIYDTFQDKKLKGQIGVGFVKHDAPTTTGRSRMVLRFSLKKGDSTARLWGIIREMFGTWYELLNPNIIFQDFRNTQVPRYQMHTGNGWQQMVTSWPPLKPATPTPVCKPLEKGAPTPKVASKPLVVEIAKKRPSAAAGIAGRLELPRK